MGWNRDEICERLSDLRHPNGGKTISLAELSKGIEKKTGVYISAAQLGKYEDSEKTDIMNAKNLLAIADYYDKTCDYILRGVKTENVDIHKRTGLSDNAIKKLESESESYESDDSPFIKTLNALIENGRIIQDISQYLFWEVELRGPSREIIEAVEVQFYYSGDIAMEGDIPSILTPEQIKSIKLLEIQTELRKLYTEIANKRAELEKMHLARVVGNCKKRRPKKTE